MTTKSAVVRGAAGFSGPIAADYHLRSTPSLICVDRKRIICARLDMCCLRTAVKDLWRGLGRTDAQAGAAFGAAVKWQKGK